METGGELVTSMRACLVKISPLNPATSTRVDLFVSSVNDRTIAPKVNGLGGNTWTPALKAAPLLTMNLWNGDFQQPVTPGAALVPLKMEAIKRTDPHVDTYFWVGAPVEIYAEEPGTSWPWPVLFKGTVETFTRTGQDLGLTASVGSSEHDKDVLTATYAGTSGAEGGADLKNKLKPLVIGWAKNVEPVLVDTVNNVHQLSGYGPIEEVTTLFERGSAFSTSIGDYATYAALVAATIPPGRWGTCLAQGMIRLGAPAYGVITADVKGHRVGSTTPRLTGAVIGALATIAGVSAGVINAASLAAMDIAAPYPVNLVLRDQVSWLETAQRLALACNHQAGLSLTGSFFVAGVGLVGTEVMTLDAQGKALPQVSSSDELEVSVPYYKTIMGANRSWRVHTADEIAFNATLVDKGSYSAEETYREGNYVTMPDASQWLYVAPTPSSGNAPPSWPTTSNLWWENMNPPIDGVPGPPGNNSATVFLYQRTSTNVAPAKPSTDSTYTFVGAALTGHNNGWTQTVPAASGGPYLWVTTASAVSPEASVEIASSAWAAVRLLAQDGEPGPPGPPGGEGAEAITATVTLPVATVYAYADGTVDDFSATKGKFTLWKGSTDITSLASLSISGSAGITGQINDAGNTPIGSSPKGTYRATGVTVDNGTLTISALYGGITYTQTVSLVRLIGGFKAVAELPTSGNTEGRTVSMGGKLYVYTGGAWRRSVSQPPGANLLVGAIPGTNPNRYVQEGWNPDGVPFSNGGYGVVQSPAFGAFPDGYNSWTTPDGGTFAVEQTNANYGSWHMADFYLKRIVNSAGATTNKWPVEGNKAYEFSAYTGAHGCKVELLIIWYDAAGNQLAAVGASDANDEQQAGGLHLAGYKRLVGRAVAPSNAVSLLFILRKGNTKPSPGRTSSWMFITRPMLCEIPAGSTDDVPWSPPPPAFMYAETFMANSITTNELATSGLITNSAQINNAIVNTGHMQDLSVNTLKIAGRAVTLPSGVYTPGLMNIGSDTGFQGVQALGYVATGELTTIVFSFGFDPGVLGTLFYDARLLRNGVQVWGTPVAQWAAYYNSPMICTMQLMDTPPAGWTVYDLQIAVYPNSGSTNLAVRARSITAVEYKR